eukprot:CFRG2180T1
MKFTTTSWMHLVGLAAYLAGTGTYAAPTGDAPANIQIEEAQTSEVTVIVAEGELENIDARGRAKHSLTSLELSHLKRVTKTYNSIGNYKYKASNFGSTDEYSVTPGDAGECLVMIAATDSLGEWASNVNLDFDTLESGGKAIIKAHDGFIIAAKAMHKDGLVQKIEKHCGSPDVVSFVGHSRGGGIAQILSAWYYHEGLYNTVRLLSWGSPRAMSDKYADLYHKAYYQIRVVNDNDIITRNPTRHFGYKHFGTVVCLDCKKTNQDSQADFSFNLLNHLMSNYNKKIQSIKQ